MKRATAIATGIIAVIGTGLVSGAESGAEPGAEEAQTEQQDEASERYSELVKEKGEFRETWVLPGVDPSKYNKVFLWQGQFQYRDVGPAQKTRSSMMTHKREFGISEEDRQKFEEIVGESFRKEIAKGKKFAIVESFDEVDTATLILRGGLLDIVSRVPPEMVGRSDVYLSSIGEATFVLELIDAQNGSVVALVAERRAIETLNAHGGAGVPANSASIMGDIRRWGGSLARRLRSALDKAIKNAAKA